MRDSKSLGKGGTLWVEGVMTPLTWVPVPDLVDENLQAERNLAIGPIPTKIGVFAD